MLQRLTTVGETSGYPSGTSRMQENFSGRALRRSLLGPRPLSWWKGAGCPSPKNSTPALCHLGLGLRPRPLTRNRRLGPSQDDEHDPPTHPGYFQWSFYSHNCCQCNSSCTDNWAACLITGAECHTYTKRIFIDLKLFKRRFRLDTNKFVFSNRVVDSWNSLSAQCVDSCTINTFKKHVSVWLEPESSFHLEVWYVENRRYRH